MRSRRTIVPITVLLAVVTGACFFEFYNVRRYNCLECRAMLTERSICGLMFPNVSYDAYSKLVLEHEPTHQHDWRWSGYMDGYSLTSHSHAWGRRHPIWELPVKVQAKYAQLVPASELDQTLEAIDSSDREVAEAALDRVFEQVLDAP